MSIVRSVRASLAATISLKLAALALVLTAIAATVITVGQTRRMEELTLEKARVAASLGARQYGSFFDDAIDSGQLTVADVFDQSYTPIKGYDWGPHPKFHTRYDAMTDRAVLVFEDKVLEQEDFVFAVGVDERGYLPTHNTRYQKPLTGDAKADLVGNRTKRMFDDPVGIAAARNVQPSFLQEYQRDTGETMWDVSSPIYVKGKHWGGFRVGVSMERIGAHKRQLLLSLLLVFGGFALVTIGAMFVVVRRAMRPVVALTETADRISLGEALDTPIKSDAVDEIGQLTKTIDRLRVSMKAAMARLGH
ncbi:MULTISPECIES: HAMP domain-containing protein [Anaeromyxobacter]|uniref:HAMP domain-containing protein n=1 Tax=Anaeromyxobacter TaxID=161492 RepID=UPI001F563EED|nr:MULTISPECIES: HAMP domain-containing protein [unclassified Anaeromyxobacter]